MPSTPLYTAFSANPPSSPEPVPPNPFVPSTVGRYTDEELEELEGLLPSENTLCSLHPQSMGMNTWHEVHEDIRELVLLKGSYDPTVASGIPTVSTRMLLEVAPNVTRLLIDMPVDPSTSEPPRALEFLLIDEGGSAMWSLNRMASTLNALHASRIPELQIHNVTPATVRKCVDYLVTLTSCVIVDDGEARFLKMVDRMHKTHTYSGPSIVKADLIYKNNTLDGLTSLTLCDQMVKRELQELFGRALPRSLQVLKIWFGAQYRPLESREQVLAYREHGWGRVKALEWLVLTTKPPLDLIGPRGTTATPEVRRRVIDVFLHHIHGGNCTAAGNVKIALDGVEVVKD